MVIVNSAAWLSSRRHICVTASDEQIRTRSCASKALFTSKSPQQNRTGQRTCPGSPYEINSRYDMQQADDDKHTHTHTHTTQYKDAINSVTIRQHGDVITQHAINNLERDNIVIKTANDLRPISRSVGTRAAWSATAPNLWGAGAVQCARMQDFAIKTAKVFAGIIPRPPDPRDLLLHA